MTQNGSQSKDCEAKAASECVARETAQHKADGVMKHVLRVQDRLVQALQTELSMINAAKDAAQVRNNSSRTRVTVGQDYSKTCSKTAANVCERGSGVCMYIDRGGESAC